MTSPTRVAVNGYGVIGKRVADAVRAQDDMTLAGVADVVTDYRIQTAVELGIPLYGATDEATGAMRSAGLAPLGTFDDLIADSDIVVDCTPKKVASLNKERYAAAGRKAIFQGGEKHDLTGFSFISSLNYADALGRDLVRVVSCNTTALGRVVGSLYRAGLVRTARAVLFRRGTDPWESHLNAPLNTIVPETSTPSHQGPDLQTIVPDLDVVTMAAKGPFDLGHVHFTMVETTRPTSVDEVRDVLGAASRVTFVRANQGIVGQNSIVELMRDLGRPRADLWEVALWEDAIAVRPDGGEVYLVYHVPNEAIVIPETIDAIRAMTGLESDGARSIAKTDAALGIRRRFVGAREPAGAASPAQARRTEMTDQRMPIRRLRVHVPIAADARTDDRRFERLLEAHPGILGATAARAGRLLMIDYDPAVIGLADLASIVRLGGHPVDDRDS